MANFDINWEVHNKVYDFVFKEGPGLKRSPSLTKAEVKKVSEAMRFIAKHTEVVDSISGREVGSLSEKEATSVNQALDAMSEQIDLIRAILKLGCDRSN